MSIAEKGTMIFGDKYFGSAHAAEQIARWREAGETVVFALGCFDMLHVGCVRFLREAASLGDRLVVGVFDDDSVAESRGSGRPVLMLSHRLDMVAAIDGVDAVTRISIAELEKTVGLLAPDLLVVGADHPEVERGAPEVYRNEGRLIITGGLSDICSDWLVRQIRARGAAERQAEIERGETPRS